MSGSTATLTGAISRMEPEDGARAVGHDLLGVGVHQEREEGAVYAGGRLDHVRDVALSARRVDPFEPRPGGLGVRAQVVVAAVCDSLELRPADGEEVFDVARPARVVRELVRVVRAYSQVRLADSEADVPLKPLVDPVSVPLLCLVRRHEVLHLHLLELERSEDEVARSDLVAERLAGLRDAERRLATRDLGDVLEVDEDALGGLRA